jgi:hypothetical protein
MPKLTPRRVKSVEDRNKGRGNFITLKKTGDQFLGYALFVADPELADNPAYYEYFEHYTPATGYCPCAGEDCPLCAEGDNPSTRAKSMWLVMDGEDDDPESGEIKIFNLNWSMLQEFAEDGADLLGRLYRVKRLEGKGNYSIRVKTGKLTKTQLKAAMKDVADDQLETIAQRQLNRVLEEMDVAQAMEADDDEEEEEPKAAPTKARKGTAKAAAVPDEEDDEEEPEDDEDEDENTEPASEFDPETDDAFEGNVTVQRINKRQNTAAVLDNADTEFTLYGTDDVDVTESVKGESYIAAATKDEDGDFVLTLWEDASENGETGAADLDDEISDEVVTITKVNESPEDTLMVEMKDGTEFELFFMSNGEDDNGRSWQEFDIDDYVVGESITVSAVKDPDGDMVASVFPKKPHARSKRTAGTRGK